MHKDFYASGFLYNQSTQQILLRQHTSAPFSWSLFGEKTQNGEEPAVVFNKIIQKQLNTKATVTPVYDYFDKELDSYCYIFYGQVTTDTLINTDEKTVKWFTFKEIQKLTLDKQVKQNIIVGKRVIDAIANKAELSKTISEYEAGR